MHIQFPCLAVKLVAANQVIANDYNPNVVAPAEMELLRISIVTDGVTQPIVVRRDEERNCYVVVDGFHRFTILKDVLKCAELPVVEIAADTQGGLMGATIRHNRARGTHKIASMSEIVQRMEASGMSRGEIATMLGMEAEEVMRLFHHGGIAAAYRNEPYSRAWEIDHD